MDLQGGGLNYSGIELIDSFYHQNRKFGKAAQALERAAKDILAIEKIATESGEGVKF
jgi:hypothetical protein